MSTKGDTGGPSPDFYCKRAWLALPSVPERKGVAMQTELSLRNSFATGAAC
jgi:hypothetical protein